MFVILYIQATTINLQSLVSVSCTFVRLKVFTSPFWTQATPLPTYMGLLKRVWSLVENCCDQFQTGGKYTIWSSPWGMALFLANSCRVNTHCYSYAICNITQKTWLYIGYFPDHELNVLLFACITSHSFLSIIWHTQREIIVFDIKLYDKTMLLCTNTWNYNVFSILLELITQRHFFFFYMWTHSD